MTSPASFLGNLDENKDIRIYGAGISGLITGYYALKAGYKVEIHEKKESAGGLIQIEELPEGFVDSAAHTILITKSTEKLLKEIGLSPKYFPEKTKRFLVREGQHFKAFPVALSEFPKIIAKGVKKIPKSAYKINATVSDFFTPWIGERAVNQVVSTALQGIYACSANELHFRSIFTPPNKGERYLHWAKRTIQAARGEKKTSASFANGMAELTDTLAKRMKDNLFYNSSPELDENFNNIVCSNAQDAATIIPKFESDLTKIEYKSLSKITCFTKQKIEVLDGAFGALLSDDSDFHSMGIINTSHLFPERTLIKGLYQYSFICNSNEDFEHDLNILNIKQVKNSKDFHYKRAIPVYSPKRSQQVELIRERLSKQSGLIIFGNYTGAISLRKIIQDAHDFFLRK